MFCSTKILDIMIKKLFGIFILKKKTMEQQIPENREIWVIPICLGSSVSSGFAGQWSKTENVGHRLQVFWLSHELKHIWFEPKLSGLSLITGCVIQHCDTDTCKCVKKLQKEKVQAGICNIYHNSVKRLAFQ